MTMLTKTEDTVTVVVQDVAVKFDSDGKERQEWTVLLPWSKFPQTMMIWANRADMPAKGEKVTLVLKRGGRRGKGDGSLERDYWWNFESFADAKPQDEPFPVLGNTATKPAGGKTATVPPATAPPIAPVAPPRAILAASEGELTTTSQPASQKPLLERPPLRPTADKYSATNIGYEVWGYDRRAALERAIQLILDDRTRTNTWKELADEMFAWLRSEEA